MLARSERVADYANFAKQVTATSILESLVMATPVDTSKALSNWQLATTNPVNHPIEAYAPGRYGSTAALSMLATLRAGDVIAAQSRPGQEIVISNVVDYIHELAYEDKSYQASAGWVERSVVAGKWRAVSKLRATKGLL
jgi:hypothetical protein